MTKKFRRAGVPWRVLAHNKDGNSFSVEHSHTEFDELVAGKWIHIEQMDIGKWWINIGGVTVWVRADRDGGPTSVDVYGPHDYDEPVDGCTYTVTWAEEENAELNRQIVANQNLAERLALAEDERDLLGRQQQAVIDLANLAEAQHRNIHPREIYQLVITDPGDVK